MNRGKDNFQPQRDNRVKKVVCPWVNVNQDFPLISSHVCLQTPVTFSISIINKQEDFAFALTQRQSVLVNSNWCSNKEERANYLRLKVSSSINASVYHWPTKAFVNSGWCSHVLCPYLRFWGKEKSNLQGSSLQLKLITSTNIQVVNSKHWCCNLKRIWKSNEILPQLQGNLLLQLIPGKALHGFDPRLQ